jgi:hypothetical protein
MRANESLGHVHGCQHQTGTEPLSRYGFQPAVSQMRLAGSRRARKDDVVFGLDEVERTEVRDDLFLTER